MVSKKQALGNCVEGGRRGKTKAQIQRKRLSRSWVKTPSLSGTRETP